MDASDDERQPRLLGLTVVMHEGLAVLAVECACGEPVERGVLCEADDQSHWMLCHTECIEKLSAR